MKKLNRFKLFDSHCHIIDKKFPLVVNQGYLPDNFAVTDYSARTRDYDIAGGAIVSGSFQAFDQAYLLAALDELGPSFVGVTQLPATVSDEELISLNKAGVRAIRFNLKRGGSENVANLERFATQVHEVVGWHTELYVDAKDLPELYNVLIALPCVCIDHLGLSKSGFSHLLSLIEKGVFVKATGFGRVDFDVKSAMVEIIAINPDALVFGTDLPSTRAPQPYSDNDYLMVIETLGEEMARKVFYENAVNLYRPEKYLIE
ncbi:MAG: amidohydrolase family protein [Desulfuromusa sp.]|jgi:predicted TIM-barrel fold metal-dependent hydrolase|nr:amidohydrolase family protein [Desulfuromusa sp.]